MKKAIFCLFFVSLFSYSCSENTEGASQNTPMIPDYGTTIDVPKCGDGVLTQGEVCDGVLFNTSISCTDFGYSAGAVTCSSSCSLDFSNCVVKEDPVKEDPVKEDPAKEDPVKEDPVKEDPVKEDSKPVCGNLIKEDGEACDTSESLGSCSQYGDYNRGSVFCTHCQINLSECYKVEEPPVEEPPVPVCGNGVKEDGEECDDGNTNDTDLCTNICTLPKCNDGILSQNEECDGTQLTKQSCSEYNPNFDTGSLKCTSLCKIDFSSCSISPKCGDGVINSYNEECDGSVGTHTCKDIYYNSTGNVICTACKLDYSNCKESCPTNKTFKDGSYSNSTYSFHKITEKGNTYIILNNKTGVIIDSNTVQWIYSSVGDEGYYSYFKQGTCDCNSCTIYFNNKSYLNKADVKSVSGSSYTYSNLTITEVPTNTIPSIIIPSSIRTTDVSYLSCDNKECSDASTYYLNITSSLITVSTSTFNWNFSLTKALGDDTYLVHYESGYGLPNDLQKENITNPFAVIRITKSDVYSICDIDTARDITIQVLSWSKYRDVAIAQADFNSKTSYTYIPAYKESETCPKLVFSGHFYLTTKDKLGEDIFAIYLSPTVNAIRYSQNICYDKNKNGGLLYTSELNSSLEGKSYRSLYREGVIVIENLSISDENSYEYYNPNYPKEGFVEQTPSLNKKYELEFSNVDFLNSLKGPYSMYLPYNSISGEVTLCEIDLGTNTKTCYVLVSTYYSGHSFDYTTSSKNSSTANNSIEKNIPSSYRNGSCVKRY